jgi:TRAP transporter TAXI family solute receptor
VSTRRGTHRGWREDRSWPGARVGARVGALAVAVVAAVWLFASPQPVAADEPASAAEPTTSAGGLRIGAGSKGGGFAKMAEALVGALAQEGQAAAVHYTGGSCDNVRLLARGEIDVGLVQYDVAAEAFAAGAAHDKLSGGEAVEAAEGGWMCGLSGEELAGVELQLVTAIDDSAVHVLVKRPVRLDDLTQLGDRPIFAGQLGSGSMETSKVILGAAGLTLQDVNSLDLKNKAAMTAMERGELLLMLRTTEVGDDAIAHLLATGMANLNALPDSVMERLIDGFPYYRVCQIDAQTYPGLEFGVPTVCVSSVLLTARRDGVDALGDAHVGAIQAALRRLAREQPEGISHLNLRWRNFAEREPVPLHPAAAALERWDFGVYWAKLLGGAALALAALTALRNALRRRGLLGNPLTGNLEGQLSNPLVPFGGFLVIVSMATLVVWSLEHDSNARVRTLNDSFWEMNMFATGNFDSESLKTSTARVIGAAATIAGLGLLAWFTAALTSILSRDQMRLFRSLRNHIVILNFREDMLQLVRVLRSPGPLRQRAIHVVVSDALPRRVRLQLTRIRGLTIYQQNPEVPEDLVDLRLPRAARVIVLQGAVHEAGGYHPLRITRAVHHACVRLDPAARPDAMARAELGLAPSVQSPSVAGEDPVRRAAVPVTLVEVDASDEEALFEPFSRWLIPVPARRYADAWLSRACLDPAFGEFFNDVVTFREGNSEIYTVPLPEAFHGKTWREVRRKLYAAEGRAGIVPVGLYRGPTKELAYTEQDVTDSSPRAELRKRLLVNPALETLVAAGDRVLAFAEDEADLRKVLGARRFG